MWLSVYMVIAFAFWKFSFYDVGIIMGNGGRAWFAAVIQVVGWGILIGCTRKEPETIILQQRGQEIREDIIEDIRKEASKNYHYLTVSKKKKDEWIITIYDATDTGY